MREARLSLDVAGLVGAADVDATDEVCAEAASGFASGRPSAVGYLPRNEVSRYKWISGG